MDLFFFYFTRHFLNRIGKERLKTNQLRFTAISEAFGAAKEVKVGGLEQTYIQRFSISAKKFARTAALSTLIRQLPRFIFRGYSFWWNFISNIIFDGNNR